LVAYRPTDGKALQKINGIGPKKYQQLGAKIVEIIREYCEEQGI
jgi:superfamily II DNA helicase RecQ